MADERQYQLEELTVSDDFAGLSLRADKLGFTKAKRFTWETLLSKLATAFATTFDPVVTSPTYSVSNGAAISSNVNKHALKGKVLHIQSVLAFEVSANSLTIGTGVVFTGGTAGQSLNSMCLVGASPFQCKCIVTGETPLIFTVTRVDGGTFPSGGSITLYINGTLIKA